MKTLTNRVSIEGVLYSHDLEIKVTGKSSKTPNVEYITGSISLATDMSDCPNVVPVYFTYVTKTTSKGKENKTYSLLNKILDGSMMNVMDHGTENAAILHVDGALALNEFYIKADNGDWELSSNKRISGSFVSQIKEISEDDAKSNRFTVDMIITKTLEIEPIPERNLPGKVTISGYIFNYRNEILPVSFSVVDEEAMRYFMMVATQDDKPTFTQLWGSFVSQTIVNTKEIETAFGAPRIDKTEYTRKDYIITGAFGRTYEWDDPSTILASEVKQAISDREIRLATRKKERIDYEESKKNAAKTASSSGFGGYNF